MKKLGKKAMMDDLFDVLFTVTMAFFILLFMGVVIEGATNLPKESLVGIREVEGTSVLLNYLSVPVSAVAADHAQFGIEEGETFGDVIGRMKKVSDGKQFTEGSGRWKIDVDGNFFIGVTVKVVGDKLDGFYIYDGATFEDNEKRILEFDHTFDPNVVLVRVKLPLSEGERTVELLLKR